MPASERDKQKNKLEIKSVTSKAMQYRQDVTQSAVQRDWS